MEKVYDTFKILRKLELMFDHNVTNVTSKEIKQIFNINVSYGVYNVMFLKDDFIELYYQMGWVTIGEDDVLAVFETAKV